MFTIARNLLIDSARRGQVEDSARRRLRIERWVLDDDDLQRLADVADLVQLLRATLTTAEYGALHARAVEEESYAEMAQRLRCSQAVARKRVSRAVAQARAVIGEHDD